MAREKKRNHSGGLGLHGRRHRTKGRGREGSDPCYAHETVPGWMRIQWARATRLLAARWGINTGCGMGWGRTIAQGIRPGLRHRGKGRGREGSDPC